MPAFPPGLFPFWGPFPAAPPPAAAPGAQGGAAEPPPASTEGAQAAGESVGHAVAYAEF